MKNEKILLIGALGVGAYYLFLKKPIEQTASSGAALAGGTGSFLGGAGSLMGSGAGVISGGTSFLDSLLNGFTPQQDYSIPIDTQTQSIYDMAKNQWLQTQAQLLNAFGQNPSPQQIIQYRIDNNIPFQPDTYLQPSDLEGIDRKGLAKVVELGAVIPKELISAVAKIKNSVVKNSSSSSSNYSLKYTGKDSSMSGVIKSLTQSKSNYSNAYTQTQQDAAKIQAVSAAKQMTSNVKNLLRSKGFKI